MNLIVGKLHYIILKLQIFVLWVT